MSLLTPLLWVLIIAPLLLIAFFKSKETNFKFILFFLALFLADSYINFSGATFNFLKPYGLKYNWIGKSLSLLASLCFIFFISKKSRQEIGFTLKTNKNTLKLGILIVCGFFLVDIIFKLIIFPKGAKFDLETFLFQLTLPGLTEEILYRGVYLWLLNKAFLPKWNFKGVNFGWSAIIVTFLFGLIHGVFLDKNLEIHFNFGMILYITIIASLSLYILRKLSGNIIYPTIAHNLMNSLNLFIQML